MWKVGELAGLAGLTVRTLHHWDEIGLISPSMRTASGHCLYDEADVRRLYEVVALRELSCRWNRSPRSSVGSPTCWGRS